MAVGRRLGGPGLHDGWLEPVGEPVRMAALGEATRCGRRAGTPTDWEPVSMPRRAAASTLVPLRLGAMSTLVPLRRGAMSTLVPLRRGAMSTLVPLLRGTTCWAHCGAAEGGVPGVEDPLAMVRGKPLTAPRGAWGVDRPCTARTPTSDVVDGVTMERGDRAPGEQADTECRITARGCALGEFCLICPWLEIRGLHRIRT